MIINANEATQVDTGNWSWKKNVESNDRKWYQLQNPINLKYPNNVGEDTDMLEGKHHQGQINYNTHSSSEFAKHRSAINPSSTKQENISNMSYEPYMFFELFSVMSELDKSEFEKANAALHKKLDAYNESAEDYNQQMRILNVNVSNQVDANENINAILNNEFTGALGEGEELNETQQILLDKIKEGHSMWSPARRLYAGSIALYMPTDISINDSVVYNEESRKAFGAIEQFTSGGGLSNFYDPSVLAGPGAIATGIAAGGYVAARKAFSPVMDKVVQEGVIKGFMKKLGPLFGGLTGAAIATTVSPEMQRNTGELMNPNEYIAYQSTAMRSFTFNWTFLPDNPTESQQTAAIIKQFRKAAHATRQDFLMLTVPNHIVVSFHGASDMIQLPPVVIEAVNVTYNPNAASFFKHNNSPVEVGLSLTLKEITPLYRDDIDQGF